MENQTPASFVATPQVTVEQPKPNNFLVILLSVLLLFSVSIAGFFAYQTQKLVKELTVLRTQPILVATTEPTAGSVATDSSEVDPTADWKMYQSTDLGFTFKYPNNLTLETNQVDSSNYTQLIFNKNVSDSFTIKASTKYPVNQPKYLLDTESTGNKSINGETWSTYVLSVDSGLQLEKNNVLYSVIYPNSKLALIDQILSTFKFVN